VAPRRWHDSTLGHDVDAGFRPDVQVKVECLDTVTVVQVQGAIDMSTHR
jgi:hypothetical protein